MRVGACNREKEVADLVRAGHWPHASSPEMVAHVAACRACSDRILFTQAFRRERAMASGAARLESPGVLWWRAHLRRRNAALQRISRPLLGAQVFAVAVALIAAALFLASQTKQSLGWFAWIADIPRALHFQALLPQALENAGLGPWLFIAATALITLASGVFLYIASDKQ